MESLNPAAAGQRQLYERACARMAQLIPGWSDAIPSDPAVAVLELAAYLSSAQNREIDALRERHYLAYLRLLGKSPREPAPARLPTIPERGGMPWPGLRFEIDGVPFEVLDAPRNGACQVREVFLVQGARRTALRRDAPLVLAHGAPAQLWDGGAWRDIPCTDGTCGLLQSGYVALTPSGASSRLRLLVEGEPEGEPRISAVAANPITLEQRRTRSRYLDLEAPYPLPRHWVGSRILRFFLPQGGGWREEKPLSVRDGHVRGLPGGAGQTVRVVAAEPDFSALHTLRELPAEEIRLEDDGILPGSLRLMVEEDGVWYDCPVCPPEEGRTLPRGCCWDSSRKALRFGDGRDFCVPRGGRLLVAGCACTLGAGGNGAYGPLERDGVSLLPIRPAWGGQDAEDGKSAFFRAAGEQELPVRAVSLSDYEALARRTPGLALSRVKAVSAARLGKPGAGVVVLAQPRSTDPLPSLTRWQRERLRVWLERFRLIGVPLEVRPPRYCPIEVRLRVRLTSPAAGRSLRAAAAQHTDGVTGPLDFGAELSYTALFSALSAVPGVAAVGELELNALSGGGRRTQEGGLKLDADTLPYLERFQLTEE